MERIAHTPSWLKAGKGEKLPVYFLRAGSVLERDEFEAELDGRYHAGEVFSFQLMQIALEGVRALLPEEDAAPLCELIQSDFGGNDLDTKDRAQVKGVLDVLRLHWPEYQAASEQEARRSRILPTVAFLRWCDGWENVTDKEGKPVEYARTPLGLIPDDVQRRLDYTHIRSAGLEAWALQYGRAQAKN